MRLVDLLKGIDIIEVKGDLNRVISGIAHNSNLVKKDNIFVAIEGLKSDGHTFINDAISKGAKVVVSSKDIACSPNITVIRTDNTRKTLSQLSAAYFGHPSKRLQLIGVTGTNGKTTTTYMLKTILDTANRNTGLIGTTGSVINGNFQSSTHTTPESLKLHEIFFSMVQSNIDTCVMEVSSHALQLSRVENCDFDIGVFTNLTHEHLDFHKDMESYYNVKKQLFWATNKFNIVNIDDSYGRRLVKEVKNRGTRILSYSIDNTEADIYATNIFLSDRYSHFEVNTPSGEIDIRLNFPGLFNIYNSLAAAACAHVLEVDLEDVKYGLEAITVIPGRFEVVPTSMDLNIIIDYAHTPDGFKNILETVKSFAKGRIIMVFGCVGERDQSKRSVMGEIAASYCDLCILTTDNCRSENPRQIANAVKEGFGRANGNYIEIPDRAEAIRYAILNSKPRDTILITGKGHEHHQIIGSEIIPFNEREIISQVLEDMSLTVLT